FLCFLVDLHCTLHGSPGSRLSVQLSLTLSQHESTHRKSGKLIHRGKRQVNSGPRFQISTYQVSVPENEPPYTHVINLKAVDPDDGEAGRLEYSMKSPQDKRSDNYFRIDAKTGSVSTIQQLDRELMDTHYNLRIKAYDGGRPPLMNNTGMVVVRVVDINDNAPMFVSTPFQATVLENVPLGYSVIHIQAIDGDSGENARLEYRLTDTTPGFPFTINNSTGWITVGEELDRETTDFYTFGVVARDHGRPAMSSSAIVSIMVLDVNDNVPAFTEKTYSLKINEDAVVGTSVLTVTAVDRDINSVVTYQIFSGNTRNRFSITSQSGGGLITLALPLDYKQERQYVLTVMASDGTLYDTAQIFINVSDANTHRPVFQTSGNLQVLLGEEKPIGSFVTMITATDDDTGENARITYVMEDNVPQFKIDPDTGVITTQMEIDYEHQASYTLAIIAVVSVNISVLDINDNAPVFEKDELFIYVEENSQVGSVVAQITATDPDEAHPVFTNSGKDQSFLHQQTSLSLLFGLDYVLYLELILCFYSNFRPAKSTHSLFTVTRKNIDTP
uniref:Cadherin domain-containing protein n=1 Tax=Xiphophorus couchianus TaxID=32473 RepID=A0A3B5M9G7_9TELE